MVDLTVPRRRYNLAQSFLTQAAQPAINTPAQGISKILQAYMAAKGMRRAEDREQELIADDKRQTAQERQGLIDAYLGVTPGQSARTGLDIAPDPSPDRLMTAMMGSKNPRFQELGLVQAFAEPKDTRTTKQKDYEFALSRGFQGTFEDFVKAGTPSTTISNVSIPPDMMPNSAYDASQPLSAQNQPFVVIPGTDLDLKIKKDQRAQEEAEAANRAKQQQTGQDLDVVLSNIEKADAQADNFFATGITGWATGWLPNTPGYRLKGYIKPIKAALAFDELKKMREASKTGGALGSVSERELSLLESRVAALDPNMGEDALKEALQDIKLHYTKWQASQEMFESEYADQFGDFGDLTDNGIEVLDVQGNIIGYWQ